MSLLTCIACGVACESWCPDCSKPVCGACWFRHTCPAGAQRALVVVGQGEYARALMPGDVVKGRALFNRPASGVRRPALNVERATVNGRPGRLTRMFNDHAARVGRIDVGRYWKGFITGAAVVLAVLGPIVLAQLMRGGGR